MLKSNDKGASKDHGRLSLTRDRVKLLRVQTGVGTGGLFNIGFNPPTILGSDPTMRCTGP